MMIWNFKVFPMLCVQSLVYYNLVFKGLRNNEIFIYYILGMKSPYDAEKEIS